MICSEVLRKYIWHDSLVENIEYDNESSTVNICVELGNWRQENYMEGEPETLKCILKFTGITSFCYEPQKLSFNDDEILCFEVVEKLNRNVEKIKLVMLGLKDTKVITFISNGATIDIM